MDEFNEFLEEFERYLENRIWNYKKYKVKENYLYDIEETAVILIEMEEKFSRNHIICSELLNLKKSKEYISHNINIKPFCTKYVKSWVTFNSFYGEISEKLREIENKIPKLKLLERYEKWDGFRLIYSGFQLEDNNEKGYALVRCSSISSIIEQREMARDLLDSYINFILENPAVDVESERVIRCVNKFEFYLNNTMIKILNQRYIKKYSIADLRKLKEIEDLKGFWTSIFQKNIKEIPYKLFNNLENGEMDNVGVIYDIYTYNMKSKIPKLEDFNKEYFYLSVVYADDLDSYRSYNYISDDKTIKNGDIVLVNRAGEDVIGVVKDSNYYIGSKAPFPVNRTKKIIKKIESEEELNRYGYKFEDFEDYIPYDEKYDDDEYDYYNYLYYVVTFLCEDEYVANYISNELIDKKLAVEVNISKVKSKYLNENIIKEEEKFKIEILTRSDKIQDILMLIKSIYGENLIDLFKTKITSLTEKIIYWIDEQLN